MKIAALALSAFLLSPQTAQKPATVAATQMPDPYAVQDNNFWNIPPMTYAAPELYQLSYRDAKGTEEFYIGAPKTVDGSKVITVRMTPEWNCAPSTNALTMPTMVTLTCIQSPEAK